MFSNYRIKDDNNFEQNLLKELKKKIKKNYPSIKPEVINGIKVLIKTEYKQILQKYKTNSAISTEERFKDLLNILLDAASSLCENKKVISELEQAVLNVKLSRTNKL